jgi:hypothetical protein
MTRKNLQGSPNGGASSPPNSENGGVKRPLNRQNLIVSVGVAVGLVLIGMGLSAGTTGRDAQKLPAVIEDINPGPGDEVLRQSQVFIDFVEGYEAELTIDGIVLPVTRLDELTANGATPKPGAQVDIPPTAIYDPGNYTISFMPQDGAPITEFTQGMHDATVTYWKVTDGRNKSKSFSWQFEVN